MNYLGRFILTITSWLFSLGITLGVLGLLLTFAVVHLYNKDLPDYGELASYDPPTVTRLYAADGKLLAEYATEKRIFVPLKAIPKRVINAFLSAEDKNFYSHSGVDITGVARAVRDNIIHYGEGRSLVGGSTITQQVVKNFLLSNEKSIERKVKEALLAFRITQVYSKDKILELYLNEIYLGLGTYGVAAASQHYFGKPLEALTIEEAALLATQPKAPNLYNPKRNPGAALERRNWVISRMQADGHINAAEAAEAIAKPITLGQRDVTQTISADFFSEEVRRTLVDMYGSDILYKGGLVVKTTLNPIYQETADRALRAALISYDRRHGYRGPLTHIDNKDGFAKGLDEQQKLHQHELFDGERVAIIKAVDSKQATLIFSDATTEPLTASGISWVSGKKLSTLFKAGDVILVKKQERSLELHQIPEANGALLVADPHTGRILAMSGGYSYGGTQFNRATQAKRQPGSSFKPFVYMAALENGLTPATLIEDAPITLSQGANQPAWRPENYEEQYLGATTLRTGLEKSRNTMTVRIAQIIGISKCLEIGKRLGIYDNPPRNFSIVLGTSETTLIRLVNAYGMIVNGGKKITPSLIERIDDRQGKIIFRRDQRNCEGCQVEINETMSPIINAPTLVDDREQVVDPRIAYQITSILEGVVQRGTATRARVLGKTVAGKTGTTNDSFDTWFVGFSPDLVAGVYIGFDKPHTLGAKETGGSVALPAFITFMKETLKDQPNMPFRIPRGIRFVNTDAKTGWPIHLLMEGEQQGATINETFITGGPIFIPGVTPKTVLDALDNLPADFVPEENPKLPWQQEYPDEFIPAPLPPEQGILVPPSFSPTNPGTEQAPIFHPLEPETLNTSDPTKSGVY